MEKLKVDMYIQKDEALIEQMKQAYHACNAAVKYIKDLGIPDELIEDNISKIFSFVSDINYCRNCPGIKNCKKENPLLINKIEYNYGKIESKLCPCKELLKKVSFERQFQMMDFDELWLEVEMKDVDQTQERGKAFQKYVNFYKGLDSSWIYLTGSANSGRSFFAASLVVDAARKNKGPVCFINSTIRFKELADLSFQKDGSFQTKMDKLCSVPILVIDDFGNEFVSDYIRDSIVFPIINTRSNNKLFTIFTSDFSINEIETLYSGKTSAGKLRAKQLCNLIKKNANNEINLGDLSIY